MARGVAAGLVVVYHCGQAIELRTGVMLSRFTDFGASGVDIFFVISGLILTLTAMRARPFSAGGFLVRRVIRVVPIYWFYTLLKALTLVAVPGAAMFSHFSFTHLATSLFFIPYDDPGRGIFPVILVGWTLNCEALFYVLFAAIIALAPVRGMLVLCLALAALACLHAAVPAGNAPLTLWTSPLLLEFAFGVGGARLLASGWRPSRGVGALLVVAGAAALVCIPQAGAARALLWGLPALAFVLGLVGAERLVPFHRARLLLALGDSSYSIYLTHTLAIPVLASLSLAAMRAAGLGVGWALAPLVAGALVIGWIAFLVIERPVTRWLQAAWSNRRMVREAVPTAS